MQCHGKNGVLSGCHRHRNGAEAEVGVGAVRDDAQAYAAASAETGPSVMLLCWAGLGWCYSGWPSVVSPPPPLPLPRDCDTRYQATNPRPRFGSSMNEALVQVENARLDCRE